MWLLRLYIIGVKVYEKGSIATLSSAGFCDETEQSGIAINSSRICGVSKCAFVATGTETVSQKNLANWQLGDVEVRSQPQRENTEERVAVLLGCGQCPDWGLLLVLHGYESSAFHSGCEGVGFYDFEEDRGFIAGGNLLLAASMIDAGVAAYVTYAETSWSAEEYVSE